jgi:hypothetical protein
MFIQFSRKIIEHSSGEHNERKTELFILHMRIAVYNLYCINKTTVAIDLELVVKKE